MESSNEPIATGWAFDANVWHYLRGTLALCRTSVVHDPIFVEAPPETGTVCGRCRQALARLKAAATRRETRVPATRKPLPTGEPHCFGSLLTLINDEWMAAIGWQPLTLGVSPEKFTVTGYVTSCPRIAVVRYEESGKSVWYACAVPHQPSTDLLLLMPLPTRLDVKRLWQFTERH